LGWRTLRAHNNLLTAPNTPVLSWHEIVLFFFVFEHSNKLGFFPLLFLLNFLKKTNPKPSSGLNFLKKPTQNPPVGCGKMTQE